jgi:hypothetical protein
MFIEYFDIHKESEQEPTLYTGRLLDEHVNTNISEITIKKQYDSLFIDLSFNTVIKEKIKEIIDKYFDFCVPVNSLALSIA